MVAQLEGKSLRLSPPLFPCQTYNVIHAPKGIVLSHLRARLEAAIYDSKSNVCSSQALGRSQPPLGGGGGQAIMAFSACVCQSLISNDR